MFIGFVEALRRGGHSRLAEGASAAARGARRRGDRRRARAILLSRPRDLRSRREPARPLRPGVRRGVQGAGRRPARRSAPTSPRNGCKLVAETLPDARADGGDQGARLLGRDHGGAEAAARRAEGPPPGRQQVDRHRRHLALRPWRLQSRRRAHRRAGPPRPRDQGVGEARVPRPRRRRASSAPATSRSRCAACAASPAKARPTSSTSTRRSTAPRGRAGSTSTCGPSGTMRSSCCCSSTSAGRWTAM